MFLGGQKHDSISAFISKKKSSHHIKSPIRKIECEDWGGVVIASYAGDPSFGLCYYHKKKKEEKLFRESQAIVVHVQSHHLGGGAKQEHH